MSEIGEISPDVVQVISDLNVEIFNKEVALVDAEKGIEGAIVRGLSAYPQLGRDWLEYLDLQGKKGNRNILGIHDPRIRNEPWYRTMDLESKYLKDTGIPSESTQKNAIRDFWLTLSTHDPKGEITRKALEPKAPEALPQPPQPSV